DYFTGAWVIVHGYDICLRIILADGLDNAFSYNVVRQAAEKLDTHNIGSASMDQFHHFSCQEPTLSGLIAQRYNSLCILTRSEILAEGVKCLLLANSLLAALLTNSIAAIPRFPSFAKVFLKPR